MKTKAIFLSFILAALLSAPVANAAVIMTLEQVGPNVVATGSGTADLTALTLVVSGLAGPEVVPTEAALVEGGFGEVDVYTSISGPTSFGSGGETGASTGTGDALAVDGLASEIVVPHGYLSGAPLSSMATWNGTNLATLGVTPGTYTWTWGSGPDADSLTLYAGVPAPPSVPEPAPALLLTLGAAALALFTRASSMLSRKR